MFGNRFARNTAMFAFAFTMLTNPISAASPAEKNWEDLQKRGVAALDVNEYWLAEPLLKKALAQAQDLRPTDMRLPKSIAELGRLYTIRGQFPKAAAYLEAQLKVEEQLLRERPYQCIPTMGSLIQFYLNYDMQKKSVPLTMKMLCLIDNRTKTKQIPMIEWSTICDKVGDNFRAVHNYALAEKLFKTALNIKTSLLISNHLSLAASYDRIGSLRLEKNDPANAEQYFAKSLKITEKTLPPESPEIYARLDKLATCLISQKKYSEAEKLYIHAQNICQDKHVALPERTRVLFAYSEKINSLKSVQHQILEKNSLKAISEGSINHRLY